MAPQVKSLTTTTAEAPIGVPLNEQKPGVDGEQKPGADAEQALATLVAQEPKAPDWQQIKDAFDALMHARHGRLQYAGWEINRDDQGDIHVIVYTGRAPEAR
jgi:hypothetical protein